MGGFGSGRFRNSKRKTTNEVFGLDVRSVAYLPRLDNLWFDIGDEANPLAVRGAGDELSFGLRTPRGVSEIGQTQLVWSSRHLGGAQPYFICPESRCGRRVRILHIKNNQLACRSCSSLSYESQHEEPHLRLLKRAGRLRSRLGGEARAMAPLPQKPKRMRQETYEKVSEEILTLEHKALGYWQDRHLDGWVRRLRGSPVQPPEVLSVRSGGGRANPSAEDH